MIVIGLLTSQSKPAPAVPSAAVAVTVGVNEPPAVIVPETTPVPELIDRPLGRPVAE